MSILYKTTRFADTFSGDKERSENHRAESIQVKNVIFKAEKGMKKRLSNADFEKYNPTRHTKRKY